MKIDIHTHTDYSDGVNSVEEMIAHAKKMGLDGIAITDHNTVDGSLKAMKYNTDDFRVIPGIEVSSLEGHILVLNVTEPIERHIPAEEVLEKAHTLGGIAIAAHPYDRIRSGVGDLVYKLDFDAIEVSNGHTFLTSKNMEEVAEDTGLPKVGGSDAHCIEELGSVLIEVENDPLESILAGRAEIVTNVDKLATIRGIIDRRLHRLL